MKKTLTTKGRKAIVAILTFMLVLSMTTSVFAGWATYNGTSYNSGNIYLEEKWFGTQQIIHFYQNGSLARTVASEGNVLWIDSRPILENVYGTGYWCYDKWGNIYAIDTAMNLLLCRAGTTQFVVNTSVRGCTGFQRDSGLIGYLVYTNNASYSLEDLLRNNNYNTNFNNNYYVPNAPTIDSWNGITPPTITTSYPCVYCDGSYYYYYTNSNEYHVYYLNGSTLYYKGSNSRNSNMSIASSVQDVTFWYDGYNHFVVYANRNDDIYAYQIGKTSSSYRKIVGEKFSYFVKNNNMSDGYYNSKGNYKYFNSYYDESYEDDYYYDNTYPYVKKSGTYYYYYTSSSKYYKYYLSGSTLYYKGTNNSSSSTTLATSVQDITFWYDGDESYIVYANKSGDVYAYQIGKTSTSYREKVGEDFDYFDEDDYLSEGYYDEDDYYNDFEDYDEDDYDDDYPYVKKSGSYYYYYTSSSRYYKYYLSGSTLYYKGTNSSTSSTKLVSDVEEITFSDEGYIVYADEDDNVYAYQIGKTFSSYRDYIGDDFEEFDEDDYMSDGYYDRYDDYIDFDF